MDSMISARRVAALALGPVRRRGREIAWTPDWMGFGNHLTLLFWAARAPVPGTRLVRRTSAMDPWLRAFPTLRELTVAPGEVRFRDSRWGPLTLRLDEYDDPSGPFGRGADPRLLETFCRRLLDSPAFAEEVAERALPDNVLVVNVRRGDYYAPEHIEEWGFNIPGFLSVAIPQAMAQSPIGRIHLVSDDLQWCRRHLPFLDHLGVDVTDDRADRSPLTDLARLAGARRLILANSSFSYWGAHLSTTRHGDNHTLIHAPGFFNRTVNGGAPVGHDRRWQVVAHVPGGWRP